LIFSLRELKNVVTALYLPQTNKLLDLSQTSLATPIKFSFVNCVRFVSDLCPFLCYIWRFMA